MQFQYFSKMETSVQRVPKKRILPSWMLVSKNQQNTHTSSTTTASPYKKQKRSDAFWGLKRRVPLQDVSNSKKRRTEYYKEKKRAVLVACKAHKTSHHVIESIEG